MKRAYNTADKEPTESTFRIPSEKEHLFQVVDINPVNTPSGVNDDIQVVKLEIVGGEDEGLCILNRLKLNSDDKAFYFTTLFLKAIGEPYKGQFEIDTHNWLGRQLYATIKHTKSKDGTKTYANIDKYNFDKIVTQPTKTLSQKEKTPEEIIWGD